ncbi:starvation protein A, partial [Acinetobacter calcoaceticus]
LLYCKRIFERPSYAKSMTAQEKNRYNVQLNME